jgi:hypothetical protein
LSSCAWNTGALGWIDDTEIALSHAGLADQSAQEWLGAGGPLFHAKARWLISGLYQSEGAFEGRDASDQPTGSFDVSSMALGIHLARTFGNRVSLGVGTTWVNEDLSPMMRGAGPTFDGGVLVRVGHLGLGAAAQNAFGRETFGSQSYPFPTNYGVGVALDHPASGLRMALDANFPAAYYSNLRGGVEWMWKQKLALRAGYRADLGAPSSDALDGPSFGMGAGTHGLWIDYGYLVSANGQGQQRIAISFRPGRLGGNSMATLENEPAPRGVDKDPPPAASAPSGLKRAGSN